MQQTTFLFILLLAGFLFSLNLRGTYDTKGESVSTDILSQKKAKSAQQASEKNKKSARITKIDDKPIVKDQIPQVGRQVSVEGTIPDPKMIACMAVHPMNVDDWWVQNLPGPPDPGDKQSWRIRTTVFCGTETLGTREEYEIVILTENTRSICEAGKKFKTVNFPNHPSRSEILRVRRTRD